MTHPEVSASAPAALAGLEVLPDAVIVVDAAGDIAFANTQMMRLLPHMDTPVVGRPAKEIAKLRTEAGLDWWEGNPLAVDATVVNRMAEQELTLQGRNGPKLVAVTGRHLSAEPADGGLLLVLRRAEARRRRDVARNDLVSTVSHELRSPLTSVKGFTKTLLSKWDRFTDEQRKQMLATVNEDADRVTRLLGELLAVSRIDAGRLALRRQMVNLDVLVPRVLSRIQAGIGGDREFVFTHDAAPALYADPDRLDQVLTNLIENAVKYTDQQVSVDVATLDDTIRVSVSDRGQGIEPQYRQAIFSKFFRRPGEKRQGTGLGLYITKGLVEAHGGEIWVDDGEDDGAVFSFTLPQGGLELSGIDFQALRESTTKTVDTSKANSHDDSHHSTHPTS